MRKLSLPAALSLLAVIMLSLFGIKTYLRFQQPVEIPMIPGLLWPEPKEIESFKLIDQNKQPFTEKALQGKWSFLFFGYTHCPDVCPGTLGFMDRLDKQLKQQGDNKDSQYVFVSVDPARDTPEHLKGYLEYFNPAFIGATGSRDNIDSLNKQLGIIAILDEPDEKGHYDIGHSTSILLTDPEARLIGIFNRPHDVADVQERFNQIRALYYKDKQDNG